MDIPTSSSPDNLFIALVICHDINPARTAFDENMSLVDMKWCCFYSPVAIHPPKKSMIVLPQKRRSMLSQLILKQRYQAVRLLLEYGADVRYFIVSDYINFCAAYTDLTQEEAMASGFRHSLHPPMLKFMEDVGDYLPVIGKDRVETEVAALVAEVVEEQEEADIDDEEEQYDIEVENDDEEIVTMNEDHNHNDGDI